MEGAHGGVERREELVGDEHLAPGERADIIVDFSGLAGQTLTLVNSAKAPYPGGTSPDPQTNGQLMQFRVDQSFLTTDEVKAKTNDNHVVQGKPATSTEKVMLTMEAKDTGPNAGDQIPKYKRSVAEAPYFQSILNKTNEIRLANFSPPQLTTDGKAFVLFTLECRFPDRTR